MCNVVAGYFTINEIALYQSSCTASISDNLGVGLRVTFDPVDVGSSFKATLQINTPQGTKQATTPYQSAIGITTFHLGFSDFGITPTNGSHTTSQFTVYDSNNNVVCQGNGKGAGLCENLTVGTSMGGGCTNCDLTTNMCILGTCVPKTYILAFGGIALLLLLTGGSESS